MKSYFTLYILTDLGSPSSGVKVHKTKLFADILQKGRNALGFFNPIKKSDIRLLAGRYLPFILIYLKLNIIFKTFRFPFCS